MSIIEKALAKLDSDYQPEDKAKEEAKAEAAQSAESTGNVAEQVSETSRSPDRRPSPEPRPTSEPPAVNEVPAPQARTGMASAHTGQISQPGKEEVAKTIAGSAEAATGDHNQASVSAAADTPAEAQSVEASAAGAAATSASATAKGPGHGAMERAPPVALPADVSGSKPAGSPAGSNTPKQEAVTLRSPEPSAEGMVTRNNVELDYAALAAAGVLTPDTAQSGVAEQIRIIKRPLLMKAGMGGKERVHRGNVIQVTSALPSEGKTFTSVNLAVSMAMELDRTVLLIDADTARSDVARILGVEAQEGLADYLVGRDRPLSDFLVKTDMPTLTILPAGKHYANMTELFASEDMEAVVTELATRYSDRIVIIDSAPLLATSGSSVIAHLVGQIVLVVEAIRTPQSAIRDALERLEGISHDHVGIVLNKSRERVAGSYGYGYGYGYGYYFGNKR